MCTPPPHISRSEETLTHLTRHTIAQVRTNKSPVLKSRCHPWIYGQTLLELWHCWPDGRRSWLVDYTREVRAPPPPPLARVKGVADNNNKLSSKSKNHCMRNYTTVRKEHPNGHAGGLLVFIHRLTSFSKQPFSPGSLSDPHLEELTIKGETEYKMYVN